MDERSRERRSRDRDGRSRSQGKRSRSPRHARRRSPTRSPPPTSAASALSPEPALACTRANIQQLLTTIGDVATLVEVEGLLKEHHNQRRRPNEPLLSVVQGLYVRYKARGYHLGAVSRFVMDGGRALLSVQAPQAGDDAPPTLLIPAESVSSLNCLAREADWEAHGAEELRELAAYLQAAGRTLLLRQAAEAVVRRRAALAWYERYMGESDLAALLPRLIADMLDEEDVRRAMQRFEVEPTAPVVALPVAPLAAPARGEASAPPREPARRESPRRRSSARREESPRRRRSPQREEAPRRRRSPQREEAPRRQLSPQREEAPLRQRSPQREQAPRRQRSPQREKAPRRQLSPQREEAPRRQRSPQREEAPLRQRSPQQEDRRKERREERQDAPLQLQQQQQEQQQEQQPSAPVQPLAAPTSSGSMDWQRGQGGQRADTPDEEEAQVARAPPKGALARKNSSPVASAAPQPAAKQHQQRPSSSSRPAEAPKPQQQALEPGSAMAADGERAAAAPAPSCKRKRAAIQWAPQESRPDDKPLDPPGGRVPPASAGAAAGAAKAAARPKAKQQKVGSGAAAESPSVAKPVALPQPQLKGDKSAEPRGWQHAAEPRGKQPAAEPRGKQPAAEPRGKQRSAEPRKQPKELRITFRGSPVADDGAAMPVIPGSHADHSTKPDLPPGLGGGGGSAAADVSLREADYLAAADKLTVRVQLAPSTAVAMDLGGGEGGGLHGGGSLGGRFDRLHSSHHLDAGSDHPLHPASGEQQPAYGAYRYDGGQRSGGQPWEQPWEQLAAAAYEWPAYEPAPAYAPPPYMSPPLYALPAYEPVLPYAPPAYERRGSEQPAYEGNSPSPSSQYARGEAAPHEAREGQRRPRGRRSGRGRHVEVVAVERQPPGQSSPSQSRRGRQGGSRHGGGA